jgi:hypothetical protein
MDWNIFREYEIVKMYALTSRELKTDTEEDINAIAVMHEKLARFFLENPDDSHWKDFVTLAKKEGQKNLVKMRVAEGKKNKHGRPIGKKKGKHLTRTELADIMAKLIPDEDMD